MKLTASTLRDEFDKLLAMFPIFRNTPEKEALIFEDFQQVSQDWDDKVFQKACFQIRRTRDKFPTLAILESAYWEAANNGKPALSEQEEVEKDYHKRLREHNETWAQLSCSPDLPWILEQATDEIDAVLDRLYQRANGHIGRGGPWANPAGQLHELLSRHKEESIRGRACEIWKESRE